MSTSDQVLARGGLTDALVARRYRLGPPLQSAESRQDISLPLPPRMDGPATARERRFAVGALSLSPPWLVSLVVHLLAVNLLAVFCPPQQRVDHMTIIATAVIGQSPVETLDGAAIEVAPLFVNSAIGSADDAILESANAVSDSATLDLSPLAAIAESYRGRGGGAFFDIPGEALRSANDGQRAEFFGVQATGSSFVFVVDSSRSMRNGKFTAAKAELSRAIRQLSSDQSFYVLFFDNNTARMTLAPNDEPEPAPIFATPENLAKAVEWIETVEIEPETQPLEALQVAIEMLPDAIFLLSDGEFTDKGRALDFLARKNVSDVPDSYHRPKVAIHTIAFWETESVKTMKFIAKRYGGTYRFIPPPW